MNLKRFRIIGVIAGLAVLPGAAFGYDWNFTGGPSAGTTGNVRTFGTSPAGGPIVTATAWYVNGGNLIQAAALGQWSHGLGICSGADSSCTSPHHQVDNQANAITGPDPRFEFVWLRFSAPVDPTSISIETTSGADLDVTYYLGSGLSNTSATTLAGVNFLTGLAALGFGSAIHNDSSSGVARAVLLTEIGAVNSILFGASTSNLTAIDAFKIEGMAGTTPPPPPSVPEPMSILLLGSVMAGVGHMIRKRQQTA